MAQTVVTLTILDETPAHGFESRAFHAKTAKIFTFLSRVEHIYFRV